MMNKLHTNQFIHTKKRLNPDLFDKDGNLKSEIRMKLLDISDDFIKTLDIDWAKPIDIILIGSLASYNWNNYSDIDVNIIYDFSKIYSNTDFVTNYVRTKRNEWNNKHILLTIKDFPIEITVVDIAQPPVANGIYSLYKNEWTKNPIQLNDKNLIPKKLEQVALKIIKKIKGICNDIDSETDKVVLEKLSNKLKNIEKNLWDIRKLGLSTKSKEMSMANILYKIIKHCGYIDKIRKYQNIAYDKINTIEENLD